MNFEQEINNLQFSSDFVFCHVMTENPDLCKRITELAIGRKIKDITVIQDQKTIKESVDGKGVRFDVVFEDDENNVYIIEMQQSKATNLPKRARYYQSLADLESLKQGKHYSEIKDGYIIFICTFDPFKKGLYKYTAKTTLKEYPEFDFNDGTTKIFLNAAYKSKEGMTEELREFLDYVRLGNVSPGLTEEIEEKRKKLLDNLERRAEFMDLYEQF